jgi:hypothetical protein
MKKINLRAIMVARKALAAGLLLASGMAQAGTRYWDGANTGDANNVVNGVNLGGAGTWDDGTTANWWAGSGADAVWANANNDTAVFWGTAGTATLAASGGDVTVGGLTFSTTGYIIDAGANSKTLTFGAANNAITLNNVAAATITGAVAGSGKNVTLTGGAYGGKTAGTLTRSSYDLARAAHAQHSLFQRHSAAATEFFRSVYWAQPFGQDGASSASSSNTLRW